MTLILAGTAPVIAGAPRRSPRLAGATRSMPGQAAAPQAATVRGESFAHRAALVFVWLAFATSGMVFAEPAPVDVVNCGLILLLPTIGLVAMPASLMGFLAVWLVITAGGFLACGFVVGEQSEAIIFTAVSLYLVLATFIFAGFVARNPERHTRLILSGWTFAAVIAALAGIAGYFSAFPGAHEMFTKFGRAAGTFKDPNVFGPFLVVPFLYMLHLVMTRPISRIMGPLALCAVLALAVLLSFSRGAWINLGFATLVFAYLAFVTAPTPGQRARILFLFSAGAAALLVVIALAAQTDKVADLLAQRASLTQSYDVGPHGRFGGQAKAMDLILENPLGIGALVFASQHHHENPHNVYLNMALNAGWLGALLFILVKAATLFLGLRHMARATATRPLFMLLFAAFAAHVVEGFVIDTDHWRHLFMIMALMWGLMAVEWHGLPGSRATASADTVATGVQAASARAGRRGRLVGSAAR